MYHRKQQDKRVNKFKIKGIIFSCVGNVKKNMIEKTFETKYNSLQTI